MSIGTPIFSSTGTFSESLPILEQKLREAEAVVVGAGAGLSSSAGFLYGGRRFQEHFADFIAKYGLRDMYTAGFYPFASPEEYWAYWSRHIDLNRYAQPPGRPYEDLLALLRGVGGAAANPEYFVVTTNVDHCFQRAGFEKSRLFYTQGDYGLWQCPEPCHRHTYDNREVVRRMVAWQMDLRIPSELIPHCPRCGRPMVMNLRCDLSFVEDAGWEAARARYEAFLRRWKNHRLLFLELGVGGNTPGIIKYPFWRLAEQNPNAFYACVNQGEAFAPQTLAGRSLCVDGDLARVLAALRVLQKENLE